ncbi:hypothetical protein GPECTOR_1g520 [Gonium pectorale]|uniref:Rieske domain-containing protein n=1 Tax=Gonium pectorale TaxID=33097 RepID=A0A150H333_GONPE|nr:hypothetical protein GPECTOR_1g520 [Gonium pectorale]|eukprot:KXZ56579.1 hypothetical protein GPECTOR_1g520 [Gonium pectorale]
MPRGRCSPPFPSPALPVSTSTQHAEARATPSPAPGSAPGAGPYAWYRHWVPVAPLSFLDPSRPTPVTLLGESLVVWRRAQAGEQPPAWVVMRDACPHRLAPLSEGRLEAGGTRLACAYHGWEFDQAGQCTRVPQLGSDSKAAATACSSPRSCVTSYPTRERDGVLFAWLDASEEGRRLADESEPPKTLPDEATSAGDWIMNELPNDYKFWVEQGMDPAHANFLHHGMFNQYDAVPMEGGRVRDIDLHKGWRWEHRGYEKKNKDMHGLREFVPPFLIRVAYEQPSGSVFHIATLQVPIRPGVSRTYFKAGFSKRTPRDQQEAKAAEAVAAQGAAGQQAEASEGASRAKGPDETQAKATAKGSGGRGGGGFGIFALLGKVPHWVFSSQLIADQDSIMMCRQELLMRRQGLDRRSYNLNSRSDEGVSAINQWLELAGYPDSLWGGQAPAPAPTPGSGSVSSPRAPAGATYPGWPEAELPLDLLLSRQERHVRHCAVCQRGQKLVTRICVALTAAAALAAAAAAGLAAVAAMSPQGLAAVGGWKALAAVAVGAAALAWAAVQGWAFREERFVSGVAQWLRVGGFALLGKKMKKA